MAGRIARAIATIVYAAVVVLSLSAILNGASPANGQTSVSGRGQMEIRSLLQKSAGWQRQALQSLDDPRRTERLVRNAHADLRAALSAMIINASGAKVPDPLLDVQKKRAEQALGLLQEAVDALKTDSEKPPDNPPRDNQDSHDQPAGSAPSPRSSLGLVRNNIEQALRITSTLVL